MNCRVLIHDIAKLYSELWKLLLPSPEHHAMQHEREIYDRNTP
jgi:hypothetical protein